MKSQNIYIKAINCVSNGDIFAEEVLDIRPSIDYHLLSERRINSSI